MKEPIRTVKKKDMVNSIGMINPIIEVLLSLIALMVSVHINGPMEEYTLDLGKMKK
jgi:hypothetical protein